MNINENSLFNIHYGGTVAVDFTSNSVFDGNIQNLFAVNAVVRAGGTLTTENINVAHKVILEAGQNLNMNNIQTNIVEATARRDISVGNVQVEHSIDLKAEYDIVFCGNVSAKKIHANAGGYINSKDATLTGSSRLSLNGIEGIDHGTINGQTVEMNSALGRVEGNESERPTHSYIHENKNLCAKDGLEKLLSNVKSMEQFFNQDGKIYYNKLLQSLGITVDPEGIEFNHLANILKEAGYNVNIGGIQPLLELSAEQKAAIIIEGHNQNSDHMMFVERDKNGILYAIDKSGNMIKIEDISSPFYVILPKNFSDKNHELVTRDTYVGAYKVPSGAMVDLAYSTEWTHNALILTTIRGTRRSGWGEYSHAQESHASATPESLITRLEIEPKLRAATSFKCDGLLDTSGLIKDSMTNYNQVINQAWTHLVDNNHTDLLNIGLNHTRCFTVNVSPFLGAFATKQDSGYARFQEVKLVVQNIGGKFSLFTAYPSMNGAIAVLHK